MPNTEKAIIIKTMPPTTPTERRQTAARWLAPGILGALGFVLMLASLTPTLARLAQLPGDPVRQDLLSNQTLTEPRTALFFDSRLRSYKIRPNAETLEDLAMASLMQFQMGQKDPAKADALAKQALAWQIHSLSRAPANAFGWSRLAFISLQSPGTVSPQEAAASALALSLQMGPYEPSLALAQLRLAVNILDRLNESVKNRLPDLVNMAWESDPYALAHAAVQESFVSLAEAALRNDPSKLSAFRELCANEPQPRR